MARKIALRVGMFVLGLLPLIGGLLTHGLARPWGEVYPRWFGSRAGRPIPLGVALAPALTASILITTAGLTLLRGELNVRLGLVAEPNPDVTGWGAWVPGLFWLPWGVALAVAVYAYYRRRAAGPWTPARA